MLATSPAIVGRSCDDCQRWVYEDADGFAAEPMQRPKGSGKRVERPKGTNPPCWKCPKIPEGMAPKPANAVEITDQTWLAITWWREMREVGATPAEQADAICRRNAAIIGENLRPKEIERGTLSSTAYMLGARAAKHG